MNEKKRTPWTTLLMLDDCALATDRKGKDFLAGQRLDPMALCTVTPDAMSVDVPVAHPMAVGARRTVSTADFVRLWATLPTLGLVGLSPSLIRLMRRDRNRLMGECVGGLCRA